MKRSVTLGNYYTCKHSSFERASGNKREIASETVPHSYIYVRHDIAKPIRR